MSQHPAWHTSEFHELLGLVVLTWGLGFGGLLGVLRGVVGLGCWGDGV